MLNYKGLRKIQTYDGLVDYLEHHQEIIKYPNRTATKNMNDNIFDDFPEDYQQRKSMIFIIHNNKSTQVDFPIDQGVNVNINRIREEYIAKLATKRWYLGGGSAQAFNNDKQTQTMDLKINKTRYYKTMMATLGYSAVEYVLFNHPVETDPEPEI